MYTALLDPVAMERLQDLGQQLRIDSVRASTAAKSGNPTSAMSAADLMAVLLARHFRYDFADPYAAGNDHLIFSKGHAAALLYAMLQAAGAITDEELLTFRARGSRLEGHPTPRLPWVDVATGSLGLGLPVGVGLALAGRFLDLLPYRVWVLCGDGELAEGSMWEAFEHAAYTGLDNLTAIVDVNRLGQRGPTRHGWDTAAYARRLAAFGWHTFEIDGHSVTEIDQAYTEAAAAAGRPTAILARTRKGCGVAAVADQEGAHGKPLPDPGQAIRELGGPRSLPAEVQPPALRQRPHAFGTSELRLPGYAVGCSVATCDAFGDALAAVGGARADVVVLDGDVSDATRTEHFAAAHPERFFEFFIAEQQMTAAAIGMQARGWTPYLATFGAFLTRAQDFLRMAAISRASIRVAGTHAGVSVGPDGPSQMALEDLATFRAIHGSTVLYPCDGYQTARLTALMADRPGVSYLRLTQDSSPVIYGIDEDFPVGGSRVLRSSADDQVTIAAAGIAMHEALAAADQLADQGVRTRVIDVYSVKPIDAGTLRRAARETGRVITVEDHWPEGGLGDAVLAALADGTTALPDARQLAVRHPPGSAGARDQLADAGIDTRAIVAAALELIS
jgi:transketolase